MSRYRFAAATALFTALALSGCRRDADKPQVATPPAPASDAQPDEVAAERAKLLPDDRTLVEAQEWCVVSTEERLGAMGPPLKLDIKGQPVFVCCKGCKRRAEADPGKTLAKADELKAKAKAERDAKK